MVPISLELSTASEVCQSVAGGDICLSGMGDDALSAVFSNSMISALRFGADTLQLLSSILRKLMWSTSSSSGGYMV